MNQNSLNLTRYCLSLVSMHWLEYIVRLNRLSAGDYLVFKELSGASGVIIEEGTAGDWGKEAAQRVMHKSLFCLNPAGDTPSSARLFDVIVSGCILVIGSDELELPFEGILDYRKKKVEEVCVLHWRLLMRCHMHPRCVLSTQCVCCFIKPQSVDVKVSNLSLLILRGRRKSFAAKAITIKKKEELCS